MVTTGAVTVAANWHTLEGLTELDPVTREVYAALGAELLVMADCGSLDDALEAQAAGVDVLGTTLVGYPGERPKTDGPDLELLDQMVARCDLPVMVEGRVHTPTHAAEAIARGAFSVCVGTAITHPTTITTWFRDAVDAAADARGATATEGQ
jgi:N-acylglucosamine-6-phosphate 2-epimerase